MDAVDGVRTPTRAEGIADPALAVASAAGHTAARNRCSAGRILHSSDDDTAPMPHDGIGFMNNQTTHTRPYTLRVRALVFHAL